VLTDTQVPSDSATSSTVSNIGSQPALEDVEVCLHLLQPSVSLLTTQVKVEQNPSVDEDGWPTETSGYELSEEKVEVSSEKPG
jgi:hypothetical protein